MRLDCGRVEVFEKSPEPSFSAQFLSSKRQWLLSSGARESIVLQAFSATAFPAAIN